MAVQWREQLAKLRDEFRQGQAKSEGLYHAFLWRDGDLHPFVWPPDGPDPHDSPVDLPLEVLDVLRGLVADGRRPPEWAKTHLVDFSTVEGRSGRLRECFFGSPRHSERFFTLTSAAAAVVSAAPEPRGTIQRLVGDFPADNWLWVVHRLGAPTNSRLPVAG